MVVIQVSALNGARGKWPHEAPEVGNAERKPNYRREIKQTSTTQQKSADIQGAQSDKTIEDARGKRCQQVALQVTVKEEREEVF